MVWEKVQLFCATFILPMIAVVLYAWLDSRRKR
jgi:hypothetical protein